jgi:hypothetical protein
MPSPNANPTPITPPRVPLIETSTNLIDRAWYLFFLSLNNIASAVVDNADIGTNTDSLLASYDAALRSVNQDLQTLPPVVTLPAPDVLGDCCSALVSQTAEMQKQIEALQVQPIVDVGLSPQALRRFQAPQLPKRLTLLLPLTRLGLSITSQDQLAR